MTSVLLLSATSVKWTDTSTRQTHWHEASLSNSNDETFTPDAVRLHLLLDSDFEQVDAFPVVRAASVITHRSNIRAMHARFAQQYPFSIVRSPRRKAGVDCFLVHQMNLVASMQQYLQLLESKRASSVIVSVQSVSELYVSAYAQSAQARLLLIRTESGVKHVVGQSGCVLFCRTVSVNPIKPDSIDKIVASLNDTIEHLIGKALLQQADSISAIGFSPEQADQLTTHAKSLAQPLQFDVVQPSLDDVREFFVKQTLNFYKKHKHSQSRKCGHWLLKRRGQIKSKQVRAAAMVSVVVFIGSIVFTQQRNSHTQRETQQLQITRDSLSTELQAMQQAAKQISSRYEEMANVLLSANSLRVVQAPALEQLLKPLSAALQGSVHIKIQELSWVTEDGISQTASRVPFPVENSKPSALLVSLSGRVHGDDTLRIKQDTFRQFVKRLGSSEQIDSVEVMRSPLDSAASQPSGSTQSDSIARFDMSFTLSRS